MALSPAVQAAYGKLWNLVSWAASQRAESGAYQLTSAEVVKLANTAYREAGQALTFAESSAIPALFGMARSQTRAIDNLNAAPPGESIDASMIAQWPTAASPGVQAAQPEYMAKAQFSYTDATGAQQTAWVTITGITEVPLNNDALALRLTGAAISAYTQPQSEGGNYLPAEQMASFGAITQMQFYAV